jgi:hypothetical protein
MDLGIVVESGESRAPPDIVEALTLDRQGLSAAVRPPPDEPLKAFLVVKAFWLGG